MSTDPIEELTKKYGADSIKTFDGKSVYPKVRGVPTGSLKIDQAIGIGGFPRGRMTLIWGREGAGKTTIAQSAVAQAQKLFPDEWVAYVNVEPAFEFERGMTYGIDPSHNFILAEPETAEAAWDMVQGLVHTNKFSIIVVDSVTAMPPAKETEQDMESMTMGLQARLNGQALRKITPVLKKTETALVLISQARENTNRVTPYSPTDIIPGGKALKHFPRVIIEVRHLENIKAGSDIVGAKSRIDITKNSYAPPKQPCEINIYFDRGIDNDSELLEVAVDAGVIKRAGAWYKYNDINIGMGAEAATRWIKENADAQQAIRAAL